MISVIFAGLSKEFRLFGIAFNYYLTDAYIGLYFWRYSMLY